MVIESCVSVTLSIGGISDDTSGTITSVTITMDMLKLTSCFHRKETGCNVRCVYRFAECVVCRLEGCAAYTLQTCNVGDRVRREMVCVDTVSLRNAVSVACS